MKTAINNTLSSVGIMSALLAIIYGHDGQPGVATTLVVVGAALLALSFAKGIRT